MRDDDFLLLSAYHDGELSPSEALAMERRLVADSDLKAMSDRLGALSGRLRGALAAPPASPDLRARIIGQFGVAPASSRRFDRPQRQALAAVLLVGLVGGGLIGAGGTYLTMGPGPDTTMDAVVSGHLRSLTAPQPFDIASSNRHVVKPWFNGRTTIAPEAPDLADKGFPLSGGRIDVVNGKTVPTLVYHHDLHVISVTVVPKTTDVTTAEEHSAGYTAERWTAGDLTYWAVSDVSVKDLRSFVQLFRAQLAQSG